MKKKIVMSMLAMSLLLSNVAFAANTAVKTDENVATTESTTEATTAVSEETTEGTTAVDEETTEGTTAVDEETTEGTTAVDEETTEATTATMEADVDQSTEATSDKKKQPIEETDLFVEDDGSGFFMEVVDSKGNVITEPMKFRTIDTKLSPNNTVIVHYPEGNSDLSAGLYSADFKKQIVPKNFYTNLLFTYVNDILYARVENFVTGDIDYYNMEGELVANPKAVASPNSSTAGKTVPYDAWAKDSIESSIVNGIVPEELQKDYKKNITRQEFCDLAMCMYKQWYGYDIEIDENSAFTDTTDPYVTLAYSLGVVAGTGEKQFSPDKSITRQEAAVMLNNLAEKMNKDTSTPRTAKYIDDDHFATWAKKAIYSVAGLESEDTFVMTGTEKNKFSPWMNYTREQAISTIWRLYCS